MKLSVSQLEMLQILKVIYMLLVSKELQKLKEMPELEKLKLKEMQVIEKLKQREKELVKSTKLKQLLQTQNVNFNFKKLLLIKKLIQNKLKQKWHMNYKLYDFFNFFIYLFLYSKMIFQKKKKNHALTFFKKKQKQILGKS